MASSGAGRVIILHLSGRSFVASRDRTNADVVNRIAGLPLCQTGSRASSWSAKSPSRACSAAIRSSSPPSVVFAAGDRRTRSGATTPRSLSPRSTRRRKNSAAIPTAPISPACRWAVTAPGSSRCMQPARFAAWCRSAAASPGRGIGPRWRFGRAFRTPRIHSPRRRSACATSRSGFSMARKTTSCCRDSRGAWRQALKSASATDSALYANSPTANHNSWDPAYATPELWNWMFAQKRR